MVFPLQLQVGPSWVWSETSWAAVYGRYRFTVIKMMGEKD